MGNCLRGHYDDGRRGNAYVEDFGEDCCHSYYVQEPGRMPHVGAAAWQQQQPQEVIYPAVGHWAGKLHNGPWQVSHSPPPYTEYATNQANGNLTMNANTSSGAIIEIQSGLETIRQEIRRQELQKESTEHMNQQREFIKQVKQEEPKNELIQQEEPKKEPTEQEEPKKEPTEEQIRREKLRAAAERRMRKKDEARRKWQEQPEHAVPLRWTVG